MQEVNPISSKGNTKERIQNDEMLAVAKSSLIHGVVQDEAIVARSMEATSYQAEDRPSSSKKKLKSKCQGSAGQAVEKSDGVVQDQIILAPEIMSLILEQLDLQSLKRVRLVCKSWLREAQIHMRRRAIVRFERKDCTARVYSFSEVRRGKLPTLPSPFESIEVNMLWRSRFQDPGHKGLLSKFGSLRPPLLITRFHPAGVSMKLALPLIIKWSPTLEYLKLVPYSCGPSDLPPMDPKLTFPQLRNISTETSYLRDESTGAYGDHFPAVVAWIVNASPSLEAFESHDVSNLKQVSEGSLTIELKNVKKLVLSHYGSNTEYLDHFLSTPFSRLENLKIKCSRDSPAPVHETIFAAVKNSAHTLKTLNLYECNSNMPDLEFPLCPFVHELVLPSFRTSRLFIFNPFPSLQALHMSFVDVDVLGDFWRELPPFVGVKYLKTHIANLLSHGGDADELPLKFFEKFPSLERFQLNSEFLLRCCQLKATGEPRFSKMLDGVRHLELYGNFVRPYRGTRGHEYSLLRFMKGIETFTMIETSGEVNGIYIPFREMPSLKVLEFPWGDCRDFDKLLELASGMEKVLVTNCCSVPRVKDQQSKDLLNTFFDSVPSAECGCRKS